MLRHGGRVPVSCREDLRAVDPVTDGPTSLSQSAAATVFRLDIRAFATAHPKAAGDSAPPHLFSLSSRSSRTPGSFCPPTAFPYEIVLPPRASVREVSRAKAAPLRLRSRRIAVLSPESFCVRGSSNSKSAARQRQTFVPIASRADSIRAERTLENFADDRRRRATAPASIDSQFRKHRVTNQRSPSNDTFGFAAQGHAPMRT